MLSVSNHNVNGFFKAFAAVLIFGMRKILLRVAFVFLALFFAVLIFEVFLRLFAPEPSNLAKLKSSSSFLYENKPNAFYTQSDSDGVFNEIRFNSSGFRDNEFSEGKKQGVFRIAILGDSFEESVQLALSDTWQKVLERQLKEAGKDIEVYNFGVSGYGTDQEWLTLKEKVWKFKPDLVILAFTGNDVGDVFKNNLVDLNENGQIYFKDQKVRAGGNKLGRFVRETYFYHYALSVASRNPVAKKVFYKLRTQVLGFKADERFFLSDAQLVQGPFEVIASQEDPPKEVEDSWLKVEALISDMNKQAQEHGARFLVTTNVNKSRILPEEWNHLRNQYNLNEVVASPHKIVEHLADFLSDKGIAFYDPYRAALEWEKEKGALHFKYDAHFNKNGSLFMGTAVSKFLLDKELVK